MAYGVNHYVYQNIIDPNRPKPVKAPTRASLTAAQKADAIARIKALAEELAAKDAEAVARVSEEARAARRRETARAANDRYKEKIAADPVLAEARRMTKEASREAARARKKGMTTAAVLVEEAKRVEDKNARLAAALQKIAERRERKAEKVRRRDAKRTEARRLEKIARLEAEAKQVEAELQALLVTEEDVVAYQCYMTVSQDNRDRYHYLVGRPLSDDEETTKERAVKARLLAKLRENPRFLDHWKKARDYGSHKPKKTKKGRGSDAGKERKAAKDKVARAAKAEERRLELRRRAPEVDAALLAYCPTDDARAVLARYLASAESLANRWRKRDNYPVWEGSQLEEAMMRKKERLLARLREDATFLEAWDYRTRSIRRDLERRKASKLRADPVKYAAYRERENRKKAGYRARDKAAQLAQESAAETESELFDRLMKIYNDARRKVERGAE